MLKNSCERFKGLEMVGYLNQNVVLVLKPFDEIRLRQFWMIPLAPTNSDPEVHS